MSSSPADTGSSSESALGQESSQDFEPKLQPVAGGGQPVAGGGVGLEPRVSDRYFVIDTAIRRAAPTFCRRFRGRRCQICHLRVAQHGFVSHVKRCIAGFNAGTAARSPMGADSRGVWRYDARHEVGGCDVRRVGPPRFAASPSPRQDLGLRHESRDRRKLGPTWCIQQIERESRRFRSRRLAVPDRSRVRALA